MFFFNGIVNRHNCCYWSNEIPRLYNEVHYCIIELLQDVIDRGITNAIESNINNHPQYIEDHIIFQQDGATPHYAVVICEYFNET